VDHFQNFINSSLVHNLSNLKFQEYPPITAFLVIWLTKKTNKQIGENSILKKSGKCTDVAAHSS